MDIELFGNRLKELRGKESQADCVARILEKTGVSLTAQTLGRYENGKRKPDIEIIEALAKTFGVSADYLLGLSDVPIIDELEKEICNYTGLSEEALKCVFAIRCMKFSSILNSLIENYHSAVIDIFLLAHESELVFTDNKETKPKETTHDEQCDLIRYRLSEEFTRALDEFDNRRRNEEEYNKLRYRKYYQTE